MPETRWATESDAARLAAFFEAQIEDAMFPLSNLRHHGLSGAGHRHATRFLVTEKGGAIRGTVGVTRSGMLLPTGRPDLCAAADALQGIAILGAAGPAAPVSALMDACGIERRHMALASDELHSSLALAGLRMPPTDGLSLHPQSAAPRPLLIGWRADYLETVNGFAADRAREDATRDIDAYLAADTHRVLMREGVPVAMTGFNASLPEIVQVGGVYTRPDLRGRGLARAAVALHLAKARAAGVRRAILFSMSDAANRAYKALGFVPIGRFGLVLFHSPQEISPCR